jgi:hypothetical protein
MIGIYKITNPKGRVYIGQAVNIYKRKQSYEKLKCKGQPRLYASLVKYGFSEHIFEVAEQCSIEELNKRERYWQDYYNVVSESGLNCKLTKTDDRSGKISKISIQNRLIPVNQYTKTGKHCHQWVSAQEAGNILEIDPTNISNCIRGTQKTAGGFIWRKAVAGTEDIQGVSKRVLGRRDYSKSSQKNSKKVQQITKQGVVVKNWNSMTEAAKELNTSVANISAAIKTNRLRVGYFWKIITK